MGAEAHARQEAQQRSDVDRRARVERRDAILGALANLKGELDHPDTRELLPDRVVDSSLNDLAIIESWVSLLGARKRRQPLDKDEDTG